MISTLRKTDITIGFLKPYNPNAIGDEYEFEDLFIDDILVIRKGVRNADR